MKTKTKICGIYTLVDPNTKEVRYVGASKDCQKRFLMHCRNKDKENKEKHQWVDALREQN